MVTSAKNRMFRSRSEWMLVNRKVLSGITVLIIWLILSYTGGVWKRGNISHTVDGNGNAFCEDVTISTFKGRDAAKLVELQVVGWQRPWTGVDKLDIEVVLFRDGEKRCGTWVSLRVEQWMLASITDENSLQAIPRRSRFYRKTCLRSDVRERKRCRMNWFLWKTFEGYEKIWQAHGNLKLQVRRLSRVRNW